jgi:glycine C-acetyltransferase
MSKTQFLELLQQEVARIDEVKTTKRHERIIEGFTDEPSPKAIINGKPVQVFNSNDYLGLRHNAHVKTAEHIASDAYGAGPGAVRFISGTLKVHRDLERAIAAFHGREDAIIYSSAFAANLATMFCLSVGQTRDSVVTNNVLVISDELNHRSIIDGIRLANLPKEQRKIFKHMDPEDLAAILKEHAGKFERVLVVTDGVFSMLGEYQHLKRLREVIDQHDASYERGILLVVDDCHGVGIAGQTGRGVEEIEGVHADVLIGTFGKAFGSDGGYVTGSKVLIEYLRENSATYIYSNNISPGTAGAALRSIQLIDEDEGMRLLDQSRQNVSYFKTAMKDAGFTFAADSGHPIQPVLIGDTAKTKQLVEYLFQHDIMVTNISYPVVAKGRDEIRVQVSAVHTREDLDMVIAAFKKAGKELSLLS